MFESLKKAIDEIFGSVIRPIKEWVLRQSWGVRVLCLIILSAAAFSWWKPQTVAGFYQQGNFYWRSWRSDTKQVPLSRSAQSALALALDRLAGGVEADLDVERDDPSAPITPWSAAQSVVALRAVGKPVGDSNAFVTFANQGRFAPDCFCWTERADESRSEIVSFIGGWVMAAFADIGQPLTAADYDYLLHQQNGAGWWPMFPESGAAKYPSTYATGWIVLGLHKQRTAGLVPAEQRADVDRAIRRATMWLLRSRDGARWQAHPGAPDTESPETLSGFTLHVLHQLGASDLADVDRAWLDSLPTQDLEPISRDDHYMVLPYSRRGSNIDRISEVRLPWILAATADAYASGTTGQKARTLTWIEARLLDPKVRNADTKGFDWVRAELLIGLAETGKLADCKACQTAGRGVSQNK